MSEAKHTPGPWSVDLETGQIDAADGQATIGTIYGADDYPCLDDDDEGVQTYHGECRANARLIAAAPDLLVALEHILADPFTIISKRSVELARAAIAAANGATS